MCGLGIETEWAVDGCVVEKGLVFIDNAEVFKLDVCVCI